MIKSEGNGKERDEEVVVATTSDQGIKEGMKKVPRSH